MTKRKAFNFVEIFENNAVLAHFAILIITTLPIIAFLLTDGWQGFIVSPIRARLGTLFASLVAIAIADAFLVYRMARNMARKQKSDLVSQTNALSEQLRELQESQELFSQLFTRQLEHFKTEVVRSNYNFEQRIRHELIALLEKEAAVRLSLLDLSKNERNLELINLRVADFIVPRTTAFLKKGVGEFTADPGLGQSGIAGFELDHSNAGDVDSLDDDIDDDEPYSFTDAARVLRGQ